MHVSILHLPIMMMMMDEIAKGLLIATAINKVSAYEGLEQQNEGRGGFGPKVGLLRLDDDKKKEYFLFSIVL